MAVSLSQPANRRNWTRTLLGEEVTLQRGFDITRAQQHPGRVPVITSSGISSYHDRPMVKGPGVVIGRKGSLGTAFYMGEDYWPHDTTLWVKDFHGNVPKFVYYFLQTLGLQALDVGAANPTLNRNHVHAIEVWWPDVSTQRKIAAILSAYDDLIENNTRRIAILEQMAQALYREWFVAFRFPGHEHVRMVDSPLGPIPEGWEEVRVGDVAGVYRGRSYRGIDLVDGGGLPFLNLKCIERDGGFRPDGLKRYQGPYKAEQTAKPGDIVMAVTDMTQERRIVARAARVPDMGEPKFVFSMDLVKLVPNSEIPLAYLYGTLRYTDFPDEVKQHANGANVLHLNPERIEAFRFALAPGELQRRFADVAEPLHSQHDILQIGIVNLRETRDLLLPKLIAGEVDVEGLALPTDGGER